jgi:hypothetical protein
MVTGRVCKNILGLFNNGIKETLEVKLKLVPVPTCMQKEYVENLERYHSLSQIMPEGLDYTAWSDFLKENPTLGQLAQPRPEVLAQQPHRHSMGGFEPFHQMLTRQSPSQEPSRNDSFYEQSHNSQPTRASSPAMSTLSFHHYQYNPDSRPNSRASVRSEASMRQQPFQPEPRYIIEEQEDGPPKKRARIIQAKRPRNTALTAHNDSLRVTASTAASVRLHRPVATNSASTLASTELMPRAPTPRPGDMGLGSRGSRRPPAPSTLRHGSFDVGRPYMSPYDTSFSDNAMDSADEDRDGSPSGTLMDMPSSPPVVNQRTVSPAPSSPSLPALPHMSDSGFVSDMPLDREEEAVEQRNRIWDGSDLPLAPEVRTRPQQNRSHHPWKEVNPGPTELLPQSYVPPVRSFSRAPLMKPVAQSIEHDTSKTFGVITDAAQDRNPQYQTRLLKEGPNGNMMVMNMQPGNNRPRTQSTATDSYSCTSGRQYRSQDRTQFTGKAGSPDSMISHVSPGSESEAQVYSRAATPNLPTQQSKAPRARGLPRSQTWSGAGEPMSDAPTPSDGPLPRSGSHAKRKKHIKDKLENALVAGDMPDHCSNCGEIDTPTWRKTYTRVEQGSPDMIELTPAGIVAFEVIQPPEGSDEKKYRIYKNKLTLEEKAHNMYKSLNLCNPCGLWLIKKGHSRPQKLWEKSSRLSKRKRNQTSRSKSMGQDDNPVSDAVVPEPEAGDVAAPRNRRERAMSVQSNDRAQKHANVAAQMALERAVQSSPVGVRGSKNSPIDLEADLTPKPTRRILFPSPRKDGEVKSLAQDQRAVPAFPHNRSTYYINRDDEEPEKPRCERCKRLKKGCDRERPCSRCEDAGIGHDGCIPCEPPRTYWFEKPVIPAANTDEGGADKENCPPPMEMNDDLSHLFEETSPPKTTPKKDQLIQDFLKTPTPGSRHRVPLTPKQGADNGSLFTTPSRNISTPHGSRGATTAPETPFTRQLNALLSDCMHSSPSQILNFSAFPSFSTPGRHSGSNFTDFINDDFLSSDMPISSSPPKVGELDLGFDLYEDPNTSSAGLWEDTNMFGSDAVMLDIDNGSKRGSVDVTNGADNTALLKMNVGGITVDFAAMIDDVVGGADSISDDEDVKHVSNSPGATSQAHSQTPEIPAAE